MRDYGYSQSYTEIDRVPFDVIRECRFIFGLSHASARHMWEVNNEKPIGEDRVTTTLISDTGDALQICSLYSNPLSAWVLCWSNEPKPVFIKDVLTLGKVKGFEEIHIDFFAENESFFNEYDGKIEFYGAEMYKLV